MVLGCVIKFLGRICFLRIMICISLQVSVWLFVVQQQICLGAGVRPAAVSSPSGWLHLLNLPGSEATYRTGIRSF